jgi:Hepatocellular carcinoma-associated antigen 59
MAEKAAAQAAPSLFRKVSKKKLVRKREDGEGEEQDDDAGATEAIQMTKKKRKLLTALSYKRGLDAKDTLKSTALPASEGVEAIELQQIDASKDPDRVRAFSGGTGKNTSSDGILEQKHKAAMEDYIQQNLKTGEETQQDSGVQKVMDLEGKLLQDLQLSAQRLSGTVDTTNEQAGEGDLGAGGAMLGGTGIAEVILPLESRMAAARATEDATSRMKRAQHDRYQQVIPQAAALPMSFSIGAGKLSRRHRSIEATQGNMREAKTPVIMSSSTELSIRQDLPSSYNHNFKLHSQERRNHLKVGAEESHEETSVVRMGFAASRRFAKGDEPTSGGAKHSGKNQQSSDTRVFRDFVKHQKEKGF